METKKRAAETKPRDFVQDGIKSLQSFDPGVIGRGFQLTLVGAYRALQNPSLFQNEHYREAAIAVGAGIAIRILVALPVLIVRLCIAIIGLFTDLHDVTWDDSLINSLHFLENNVLQLPLFFMSLTRHLSTALDSMFMESLRWVDQTYLKKHAAEDPSTLRAQYYPNLVLWSQLPRQAKTKKSPTDNMPSFLVRSGRKAAISMAVYILSYTPYVGRLVLPAASFYSLNNAAGAGPAAVVSVVGLFVPRRYTASLLQSYYASRSLTRELLVPYFSRMHFTPDQKKLWFKDREGLLFGFGVGFYLLMRMPLFGVLIYGIAEASTAYLITKITDPPPPPTQAEEFIESQIAWKGKEAFMKLSMDNLDHLNEKMIKMRRKDWPGTPLGFSDKSL